MSRQQKGVLLKSTLFQCLQFSDCCDNIPKLRKSISVKNTFVEYLCKNDSVQKNTFVKLIPPCPTFLDHINISQGKIDKGKQITIWKQTEGGLENIKKRWVSMVFTVYHMVRKVSRIYFLTFRVLCFLFPVSMAETSEADIV